MEDLSVRLAFLTERLAEGRVDRKDIAEIRELTISRNKVTVEMEIPEEITSKLCPSDRIPKKGDWIYVRGSMSFDHGYDDVVGGLAEVSKVSEGISAGKTVHFIKTAQHGMRGGCNWEGFLAKEQEKLAERYGYQIAFPDPDYNSYEDPGEWK